MKREAVREYVEHTQSIIETSPQMDEANTKAAVLRDFLELLGWKIPTNTQLEYSVKAFNKTYKVDYALVLEGAPVAFIEAKGVDTSLTDKHRKQLAAYLKNEDVNWGVLTNGVEYEFYRRQVIDSKVNVAALADTELQNLPDKVSILRAFTKEAIQTGDSEKIATRINELKHARELLEAEKENLATDVTKLLTESVSDSISSSAESQAKEMIDRLIQDIESEIDSDKTVSPEVESGEAVSTTSEPSIDASGDYIVKLQNNGETLATFANNYQSQVMAEVVSHLIENCGLVSKMSSIPYVPGDKNAVLSDRPVHPNGNEMKTYRELPDGYYVYTNLNKDSKMRYIRKFAEKCGFEANFEGEW